MTNLICGLVLAYFHHMSQKELFLNVTFLWIRDFFYLTGRKFSPGACKNDAIPPNLDLDEEDGEHEGEGSPIDDEFLAA